MVAILGLWKHQNASWYCSLKDIVSIFLSVEKILASLFDMAAVRLAIIGDSFVRRMDIVVLSERYPELEIRLFGMSGATFRTFRTSVEFIRCSLWRPNAVLVILGTNDLDTDAISMSTVRTSFMEFPVFIRREIQTVTYIKLMSLHYRSRRRSSNYASDVSYQSALRTTNRSLRRRCPDFAAFFPGLSPSELRRDGVHPTPAGMQRIYGWVDFHI